MTEPSPVRKLFADNQPIEPEDVTRDYVAVASIIAKICASRILLMIAVLTGALIWSYSIYSPERDRLYVAIAYSIVFVLPQVILFLKKG